MENIFQLFLLSLLASIIALFGGIVFLFNKRLSGILELYSIPFATGVLITVALIGILPEAYELAGTQVFAVLLATFLAAYCFEHFLFGIHHHKDKHHNKYESSVVLVLIGDTIHNFIDGIAIGASFLVNPGLGLITSLSTFLHEIPHEIGDFGVLLKAGWRRKNILIANLASASTTIAGAFFVYLSTPDDKLTGVMLAIAAGIFLYLGTIDFLPEIRHHKNNKLALLFLILGVFSITLTLQIIPHSH